MDTFILVGANPDLMRNARKTVGAFSDAECIMIGPRGGLPLWQRRSRRVEMELERADDELFVDYVNRFGDRKAGTVVLPVDVAAIRLMHRVRDRVQPGAVPFPDVDAYRRFGDADGFSRLCGDLGMPAPDTVCIAQDEHADYREILQRMVGEFTLQSGPVAYRRAERIRSAAHFERRLRRAAYPLTVRSCVAGEALELGVLAIRGQMQALAIRREANGKVAYIGHAGLHDMVSRLVSATAYHGFLHLEARVGDIDGRAYLIDTRPGCWSWMHEAASSGLNFIGEALVPARRNQPAVSLVCAEAKGASDIFRRLPGLARRPADANRLVGLSGLR